MAERDRARDRARPFAHRVAVVAALHDRLRTGAPGDDADVMPPHHDGTDTRTAGVAADRGPIARDPQVAPRHAELLAEPPAAPRTGPARGGGAVRTRLRVGLRNGNHASEREKRSDEFLLHHHSWVTRAERPGVGRGRLSKAQSGEKMAYAARAITHCGLRKMHVVTKFGIAQRINAGHLDSAPAAVSDKPKQGAWGWNGISSRRSPTASRP